MPYFKQKARINPKFREQQRERKWEETLNYLKLNHTEDMLEMVNETHELGGPVPMRWENVPVVYADLETHDTEGFARPKWKTLLTMEPTDAERRIMLLEYETNKERNTVAREPDTFVLPATKIVVRDLDDVEDFCLIEVEDIDHTENWHWYSENYQIERSHLRKCVKGTEKLVISERDAKSVIHWANRVNANLLNDKNLNMVLILVTLAKWHESELVRFNASIASYQLLFNIEEHIELWPEDLNKFTAQVKTFQLLTKEK